MKNNLVQKFGLKEFTLLCIVQWIALLPFVAISFLFLLFLGMSWSSDPTLQQKVFTIASIVAIGNISMYLGFQTRFLAKKYSLTYLRAFFIVISTIVIPIIVVYFSFILLMFIMATIMGGALKN
jgi:hypothetical protein